MEQRDYTGRREPKDTDLIYGDPFNGNNTKLDFINNDNVEIKSTFETEQELLDYANEYIATHPDTILWYQDWGHIYECETEEGEINMEGKHSNEIIEMSGKILRRPSVVSEDEGEYVSPRAKYNELLDKLQDDARELIGYYIQNKYTKKVPDDSKLNDLMYELDSLRMKIRECSR